MAILTKSTTSIIYHQCSWRWSIPNSISSGCSICASIHSITTSRSLLGKIWFISEREKLWRNSRSSIGTVSFCERIFYTIIHFPYRDEISFSQNIFRVSNRLCKIGCYFSRTRSFQSIQWSTKISKHNAAHSHKKDQYQLSTMHKGMMKMLRYMDILMCMFMKMPNNMLMHC